MACGNDAVIHSWFASLDIDGDGFVTYAEISAFMRRSRLTDKELAQVWEKVPNKGSRKGHVDIYAFAALVAAISDQQHSKTSNNPFEVTLPDIV